MDITENKIQELQVIEQNLQSIYAQKQAVQLELNETLNALDELKKSSDEVYRIISGIMIKSNKGNLVKELEEKSKLLDLRIKTLEKQEEIFERKSSEYRKEVAESMKNSKS